MPELEGFSAKEVIKILQKMGFKWDRTKGSHAIFKSGSKVCVVPLHKELLVGTLKGILRQAGISTKEFLKNA